MTSNGDRGRDSDAYSIEDMRKELIRKTYGAVAGGIVAGVVAAAVAGWAAAKTLPWRIGLVPANAVVAFDSADGGCPVGWKESEKGWGRFIVGAVSAENIERSPAKFAKDARGVQLTAKAYGEPGGEEKHQLSVPELPAHDHSNGEFVYLLKRGPNTATNFDDRGDEPD